MQFLSVTPTHIMYFVHYTFLKKVPVNVKVHL